MVVVVFMSVTWLVVVVPSIADRQRECRAECQLLRSRLDPVSDCKRAIRAGASNACLKAFFAAFQDECHSACMSKFDDSNFVPGVPAACTEEACRIGYDAGALQTRRFFFFFFENIPTAVVRRRQRETMMVEPPPQGQIHRKSPTPTPNNNKKNGETIAVKYLGEERLVELRAGQTLLEAAAAWCRDQESSSPACPRILLAVLQQKIQ